MVRVEDAHGSRRPSRSGSARRPAAATSCRRRCRACGPSIAARLRRTDRRSGMRWLIDEIGIAEPAARAAGRISGRGATRRSACLPTQDTLVLERFFDEAGGMQLVIHSPFGSRINRAWGLALRKRFCRKFNFELQAAATEDNIVLSLTTAHSFELAEVARYLHSASVRERADPGAARRADVRHALALGRRRGARAAALPRRQEGAAAARAHGGRGSGRRGVPRPDRLRREPRRRARDSRPSAGATRRSPTACTRRWTSTGWSGCSRGSSPATIRVVARDLTEPSPLALEVLSARPYAYLDDAPLEERRTQAVMAPALAGAGGRGRPRPARSRGDRAGARARPGPSRPMPTSCTTRWSGSAS